jgi:hypothetical protein
MHYKSHRSLMPIMLGLVKGVGRYFGEPLTVEQVSDTTARVVFS